MMGREKWKDKYERIHHIKPVLLLVIEFKRFENRNSARQNGMPKTRNRKWGEKGGWPKSNDLKMHWPNERKWRNTIDTIIHQFPGESNWPIDRSLPYEEFNLLFFFHFQRFFFQYLYGKFCVAAATWNTSNWCETSSSTQLYEQAVNFYWKFPLSRCTWF